MRAAHSISQDLFHSCWQTSLTAAGINLAALLMGALLHAVQSAGVGRLSATPLALALGGMVALCRCVGLCSGVVSIASGALGVSHSRTAYLWMPLVALHTAMLLS